MADQATAPISQRVLRTLLGVVVRKTPDEALCSYATTGNLFGIKLALAAGADINGSGALHIASRWGETEAARLLLDNKADVNAKYGGTTPLYYAVGANQDKIAELLINRGADVNARTDDGNTPLHTACRHKDGYLTALLIREGATIDAQNKQGETPLHIADLCANRDNVCHLLEAGANTCLRDSMGQTVLDRSTSLDTLWLIGLTQAIKPAPAPQTPTNAFSAAASPPPVNAQGAGPVSPKAKQAPISRKMALTMA